MFERFTEKARRVVVYAQEEARMLNQNYIGTEHLLLGLIREQDGIAAKALESLNISLEDVHAQVEDLIGRGTFVPTGHIPFTPRAKKVLELSLREALQLGHNYIGTEHILLGLIREGEGVAAQVLLNLGADLEKVRSAVIQLLSGHYGKQARGRRGAPRRRAAARRCSTSSAATSRARRARASSTRSSVARNEIERVMQILSRRTKNNPVLIGEPGVGKTAVVEGLAQRISRDEVPETIKDKQLYTLDLAALVAGSKYRGEFEDRLKKVMKEIRERGDIILFVDEMHTLVGAGAAEGAIDAASIIKPALARGELQTIGATTLDEYRKYVEKDPALERRFQPIQVGEPSVEETIEILKGLRDRYEAHHRVTHHRRRDRRGGHAGRPLHLRPLPAGQGDRPHRRGRRQDAHQDDDRASGRQGGRGPPALGPRRRRKPPSRRRSSRRPRRCATTRSRSSPRSARWKRSG